MKILRTHPPDDPCMTSLSLIAEKLSSVDILKDQKIWIPDHPGLFYQERSKIAETTTVVLLGNFIRRFLESEYWPFENTLLATTSISVTNVMEKILFVPPGYIGILDRYQLIKKNEPQASLDLTQPFTFIVSGRLTRGKNLLGILSFVSALQTEFALPARLHFIGDFDDQRPDYLGRRVYGDFKQEFHHWMNHLKWTEKPVMTPRLGAYEWTQCKDPQKILTSFSTFHGEDFNMSLAQAQQAGWFALVSNWGGHREVYGHGIYKIPPVFIPKFSTPLPFQHGQARGLAQAFAKGEIEEFQTSRLNKSFEAKVLTKAELALARHKSIEKWGMGLLSFLREDIDYFADTGVGADFFLKYTECFDASKSYPIHLVFHPHDTSSEVVVDQDWENLGSAQWISQEEISFLATTDLNFREAKIKITSAKKRSYYLSPKNQKILEDFLKDL